jgi:hypothetical protein
MQFVTAKKVTDVVLPGVEVEIENRDGSLFAVTFRVNGNMVKVSKGGYSDITLLIPAPPKVVKKFRLAGKFGGLADVSEDFDSKWDAEQRLREYEKKYGGPDDEVGLTVSEVEVEEAQ